MSDLEHSSDAERLLRRRTVLKFVAGAPLVATFGLLASPLTRFLKPTMKAGNFFQAADLPRAEQLVRFERRDFPEIWTCIPFLLPMNYLVFNPEGHESRKTPGFIMRTAKNEIVAFSRICPYCRHRQPVNFVADPAELYRLGRFETPVLLCPCVCDQSMFDPSDNGRVLGGPASRPLRQMDVICDGEFYSVTGLEQDGIA